MIWYALTVAPSREAAAERLLVAHGYSVFVPIGHRVRRVSRHEKRKVVISGPQIPGYVFLGFNVDVAPDWLRIMGLSMVHGVIGRDGQPWPLGDGDMRRVFMMHQRPIPYVRRQTAKKRRQGGYAAEIVSGPYAGRSVRIIEADGRVEALYELYKPMMEAA